MNIRDLTEDASEAIRAACHHAYEPHEDNSSVSALYGTLANLEALAHRHSQLLSHLENQLRMINATKRLRSDTEEMGTDEIILEANTHLQSAATALKLASNNISKSHSYVSHLAVLDDQ